MAISANLNARQRQAVEHGDGPLLVLAGPGAGKTRVIIHRVAHLIESGRAEPGQILALTFTNRAAQELVGRVHDLLGESIGSDVWVGTFHNTCARILRESADALGIREDFAIFDQESQDAMLVECLRHASLPSDFGDVARLRNVISARKSAMEDPLDGAVSLPDSEDARVLERPGFLDALRVAIEEYERRLSEYGAYDFDDLLKLTVERLRSHPGVVAKYHAKFRHVLVDEYQDINYTQYELLRLVAPEPYRITAVGDEDQSIYSWRGSDPKWVRRLREEMQPTVIELDEHYRSTRTVLHAATELISQNERLRETALKTNNPAGEPLYAYALLNEEEAAAHTTKLIGLLHSQAHFAYRDIAVFYRNHRQADLVEQALDRADIPIQRVRPSSEMLDADETRLVAWLRHLCFGLPKHLAAALTFPASVLDEWTRVWFQWKAYQSGTALGDVLRAPGDDAPPLTRVTLASAMATVDRLRERIATAPAGEAVRLLLDELELHRGPFHREDADAVPHWEHFPRMAEAG
ncbi:ATP-dependent helicase, partial [Candidatus Poribacteria bacterium]|nr:ATP-dependent helicase [Candidatus Poribacteria bacterium]